MAVLLRRALLVELGSVFLDLAVNTWMYQLFLHPKHVGHIPAYDRTSMA